MSVQLYRYSKDILSLDIACRTRLTSLVCWSHKGAITCSVISGIREKPERGYDNSLASVTEPLHGIEKLLNALLLVPDTQRVY